MQMPKVHRTCKFEEHTKYPIIAVIFVHKGAQFGPGHVHTEQRGVVQRVDHFLEHLLAENERYNLTAVRNKEDAYVRYVAAICDGLSNL